MCRSLPRSRSGVPSHRRLRGVTVNKVVTESLQSAVTCLVVVDLFAALVAYPLLVVRGEGFPRASVKHIVEESKITKTASHRTTASSIGIVEEIERVSETAISSPPSYGSARRIRQCS